jgi:hypothetical protein
MAYGAKTHWFKEIGKVLVPSPFFDTKYFGIDNLERAVRPVSLFDGLSLAAPASA